MATTLIKTIKIEKLFGMYSYSLPENGSISGAAILYGDNGVGKSTLLRLAFHLLSASNNKGHRSALYRADFQSLEILLTSGVLLSARPEIKKDKRTLVLKISRGDNVLAVWNYQPNSNDWRRFNDEFYVEISPDGEKIIHRTLAKAGESIPRGEEAYLSALKQHVPTMFILNADRRLDSDSVSDPSDEMELRRVMKYEEPKRINELVVRSREIALSQAINSANRWIGRKAVLGANQGSMNVHSVYVDVLHRLISPSHNDIAPQSPVDFTELLKQLKAIESKTVEVSRYELATQLSTSEFRKALIARSKKKRNLAAELLQPYIKSLESRLEAVEPIYQIINRFVTIVNGFLMDKSLSFRLSQGFNIQNKLGHPLIPAQLSSGEQQILLLFCYVLTARDQPSVFMIDEPEISLNIKWQRQLIQSLLDITDGATIQFIFASHSMELLAQHRDRVIKLANK